ncbi:MAG: hypothetical protein AAF290_00845 [Pseudomonadota bacterium]
MQNQDPSGAATESESERRAPLSEPATFLTLCATQLSDAVDEANAGARELVDAALAMSDQATAQPIALASNDSAAVAAQLEAVRQSAESIAVGLQWLDRFDQRLSHLQSHLMELATVLPNDLAMSTQREWRAFLDAARQVYTTEAERRHFDTIYGVATNTDVEVEEATDIILF